MKWVELDYPNRKKIWNLIGNPLMPGTALEVEPTISYLLNIVSENLIQPATYYKVRQKDYQNRKQIIFFLQPKLVCKW